MLTGQHQCPAMRVRIFVLPLFAALPQHCLLAAPTPESPCMQAGFSMEPTSRVRPGDPDSRNRMRRFARARSRPGRRRYQNNGAKGHLFGFELYHYQDGREKDMKTYSGHNVAEISERTFPKAVPGSKDCVCVGHRALPHRTQNKQFECMVKLGMTPVQAIRAATIDASQLMDWQDREGLSRRESMLTWLRSRALRLPTSLS